ncbi:3-phosphoshikimate 1-carboxyvinyltransferase [Porphyromonas sp.]|uniref:3-phosphoshikimate 1-carboxyvinyltransferase n=1 Tax=Porphyromonas sp. TaxID=1924944 RepID=UPI0026DC57FD|nr:3-phosphoshikimate 1-carboxyvinyltransferase [Porphyromonas sp.]MDO4770580.1 3-phosphoshikimate 1-carboxyvinyltransferase [Porphyromonas sp.]
MNVQRLHIKVKDINQKSCEISLNASKSLLSRDLIIRSILRLPADPDSDNNECVDIEVLKQACKTLRVREGRSAQGGSEDTIHIYIHQSGTAMRLMTALLAISEGTFVLQGDPQVQRRPIAPLVSALRDIGADITYIEADGHLPLKIRGQKLRSRGIIDTTGWESSQYVSALLLIAPKVEGGLSLRRQKKEGSTPYISLTMARMSAYGVPVEWQEDILTVYPQDYKEIPDKAVELDWSGAGYWYSFLCLHPTLPSIRLPGLFLSDSLQGDKVVASLFKPLGIDTIEDEDGIRIVKTAPQAVPQTASIDLSHHPDLFPTLAVTYAMLGMPMHFTGLESLSLKESNRFESVSAGLKALGFSDGVSHDRSTFTYEGTPRNTTNQPTLIDSHDDHRIAMSFAVAGAVLSKGIYINNTDCVSKSYPKFWNELSKVADITPSH